MANSARPQHHSPLGTQKRGMRTWVKVLLIVSAALFVVLLAGLRGHPVGPSSNVAPVATAQEGYIPPGQQASDEFFLQFVHERTNIPNLSDTDLIALAKNTCLAFDRGVSGTEITQNLMKSGEYTEDLVVVVAAGLANYCPQYDL